MRVEVVNAKGSGTRQMAASSRSGGFSVVRVVILRSLIAAMSVSASFFRRFSSCIRLLESASAAEICEDILA